MEHIECRACSPEIGIGLKLPICVSLCRQAFKACGNDYFAYPTEINAILQPCVTIQPRLPGPTDPLICFKAATAFYDSKEFCAELGYKVAEGSWEQCYSGQQSDYGTHICTKLQDAHTQLLESDTLFAIYG